MFVGEPTIKANRMSELQEEILYTVILGLILIYPLWRIHSRAGFNPLLSLFIFLPFLGYLIVYLMLAFRRWPATEMSSQLSDRPNSQC